MSAAISILNVGEGDTKLTFDKSNPAESIRAARIVKDMLRRGYALLVEVERNGERAYERALDFDPETCEYIIADFDPTAESQESNEEAEEQGQAMVHAQETPPKKRRGRKRLAAAETPAVAVARSAGG